MADSKKFANANVVLELLISGCILGLLCAIHLIHDLPTFFTQIAILALVLIKKNQAATKQDALNNAVLSGALQPLPAQNATVDSQLKQYVLSWQDEYGSASTKVSKKSGKWTCLEAATTKEGWFQVYGNSSGEVAIQAIKTRDFRNEEGTAMRETTKQLVIPWMLKHSEAKLSWRLPVTYMLVVANILFYFYCGHLQVASLLTQASTDVMRCGSSMAAIEQPWRLITSSFLHFAWWHIVANMLGLILLGWFCESKIGSVRFLALYVFCTISSNLVESVLRGGASNWAGASNSIMGLVGFTVAFVYLRKTGFKSPIARKSIRVWLDILLVSVTFSFFTASSYVGYEVDTIGHAAGFIFGIVGAWIFAPTKPRTRIIVATTVFVFLAFTTQLARERYFKYDVHHARASLAMCRGDAKLAEKEFELSAASEKSRPKRQKPGFLTKQWLYAMFEASTKDNLAQDYNGAAWMADQRENYPLANRLASSAILIKEDANTLDTRAVSFLGLKDYQQAKTDLERALVLKPHLGVAEFHLAQAMLLQGGAKYLRTRFPHGYKFDYQPSEWEYRFGRP